MLNSAHTVEDPKQRIIDVALSFIPTFFHDISKGAQTKQGGKPYNPIIVRTVKLHTFFVSPL